MLPRGLRGLQLPSGNIHLLRREALRGLQCGYLHQCGPHHGLQGNTCSTEVSALGESKRICWNYFSSDWSAFWRVS